MMPATPLVSPAVFRFAYGQFRRSRQDLDPVSHSDGVLALAEA